MNFSDNAKKWLDAQPEPNLRTAREIIAMRRDWVKNGADTYDNGFINGLRLALSYLSDRPGDISDTGAEGFITQVESADEMAAEGAPEPLLTTHGGKTTDARENHR